MTHRMKEPGSQSIDVAGIAILESLSPHGRRELEKRATIRSYEAGEVLWREGSAVAAMHIVLSGEVRVVSSADGRQRVIHRETRGGTLGDVALFSGDSYPATALAATRVTTIALTRDALHAVIAADPTFALHLLNRLATRVRHVLGVIDRMTNWSVQARVARHLLERGTRGEAFTLGMTQQELAEELGTVREVIVRTLRGLRDAGHIEFVGRGRYGITSRDSLERMAKG